jgi:hypothetical protein
MGGVNFITWGILPFIIEGEPYTGQSLRKAWRFLLWFILVVLWFILVIIWLILVVLWFILVVL